MRHRWYAGGIATLLSGALMFTGYMPAVAADGTAGADSTTTSTDAATPTPTDSPSATPSATVTPTETPTPTPTATPTPKTQTQTKTLTQSNTVQAPVTPAVLNCQLSGGFEIDGNYAANDCGGIDWLSPGVDHSTTTRGTYQVVKDNSDPSGWSSGGGTPPKVDFTRVYTYANNSGGHYFLDVAWERDQTSGTGGYVIEVTNAGSHSGNGVPQPDRSHGGVVFYITTQGSNPPVLLQTCVYTSQADYGLASGCTSGTGGFVGAVNTQALTSPHGDSIAAGGFFEVGLDVTALTNGLITPGCPASGAATTYMRSFTGNNFGPTGNLKGWVGPQEVTPPSTCGSLDIFKQDTAQHGLAGAVFTVTPNPTTGSGSIDVTTTAGGHFLFTNNVKPGTYTVTEKTPPPGYLLPDTVTQTVPVGSLESKALTFTDPLGSVTWIKQDQDTNLLGGATFQVTRTGGGSIASGGLAVTSYPLTVVDNGANDADPIAGQFKVINLPTGTYSVTETAAPTGYIKSAATQSFTIDQTHQTPPLQNPFVNQIITHKVTLTKIWNNGVLGDTAKLQINGDVGKTSTVTAGHTTGSWTDSANTLTEPAVKFGTTVNIAETLGGNGQYNTTWSCDNGKSGSGTTGGGFVIADADVNCTITNDAKMATVKVFKNWVDAISGDTATVSVGGNGQNSNHVSTAPGGTTQDGTPAQLTLAIGTQITVGEQLGAANKGFYSSTLKCNGSDSNGTFLLAGDTSCTFTNSNGKVKVTLSKTWANAVPGDSADLKINGITGATSPAGPGHDGQNVAQQSVLIGSTVNVSEALHGVGVYDTGYVCTPDVGSPWTNTTFTVPLGVSQIDCVVTNTAKVAPVIVKKTWVGGISQDSTTVSLNQNGAPLMTGTSTVAQTGATQTDTVVTYNAKQNTTVDVTESLAGGNKASYDTTYSCVVTGTQTPLTYTGFAVPAAGATCVVTNTAKTVTVNLNKKWVHGVKNDTTQLTIKPAAGEGSMVTGPSTVTVPDETDPAGIDTIHTTVTSGGTADLAEVLGAGNFAQYTSALACDGGSLSSGTLTVPKAGGVVTCTFTNTVKTAQITLQKAWQGGVNGDSTKLFLNAATNLSTYNGTNGVDPASTIVQTVNQGSTVTVTEAMQPGGQGTYDQTVQCTGMDSPVPLGNGYTFTAPTTPVTCTITNTALLGSVKLIKTWVNSIAGDKTDISINAGSTVTATAPAVGGDGTSTQTTTKDVTAGTAVTVSEALAGTNKGSYTADVACYSGTALVKSGPGTSLDFTMPNAAVVCYINNVNATVKVTLHKAWENAQPGDQTIIKLSQNGPGVSSAASTATAPNDNPVTLTVPVGATVTTGETLQAANHASYTASTSCDNGKTSSSDVVSFTATADASCTITNSATQAMVHLFKVWKGSVKNDSTTLSITGGQNAADHTSVSTGGDFSDPVAATSLAYTGSTVGLNESAITGSGFVYDSTLQCTNDADQSPLTVTNGQITVPATATHITCAFTNTLKVGKLTLNKSLDYTWGGSEPANAWTLTADGPGDAQVQGTTGVSKTVPIGTYTLSEAPTFTGYHLEKIVCTDGESSTTLDAANPAIELTSGANLVCTFTNTDEPATLSLKKIVDEAAAGGSVTAKDFTLTATPIIPPTPVGTLPVSGPGDGSVSGVLIPAGKYTLSESGPAGFLAGTWTCVGGSVGDTDPVTHTAILTVANGQEASCSITNTAIQPKLTLVKKVDNSLFNGAGRIQDWTLTATGPITVSGQGGSSSIVAQGVKVGTYDLTEAATGGAFRTDGYTLTSLVCTQEGKTYTTSIANPTVSLAEGDDVTCTYTNTPTPAKWTIAKTSDKGLSVMPGQTITYTLTITHVPGTSWPAPSLGLTMTNVDDLSDVAAHAQFVNGSLGASFGTPTLVGNALSWSALDLSGLVATGQFTIHYSFKINADAWNVSLRNAVTPPPNFDCVGDNDCTTVSETPDLEFWKDSEVTQNPDPANPVNVLPGGEVTYTLNAFNFTGADLTAGQTVTDDLSNVLVNGATLVLPLAAGLEFDGAHTLTWTLPAIAHGTGTSVQFAVKVSSTVPTSGYDLDNTMVPGTIGHCVVGENQDNECKTHNHVPMIDLALEKTAVTPGGGAVDDDPGVTSEYTYGLKVTNNSETAVSGATITDPLPSQIKLDTSKGTGGFDDIPAGWVPSYNAATNTVTITGIAFAAAGGSASITLHVVVQPVVVTGPVQAPGTDGPTPTTPPATIDNQACVSVALDSNDENNCSTAKVPQKTINANIWVQCVADVPYLHYKITATNVDASLPVTLTWTPSQPGHGGVPLTDLPPSPTEVTRDLHIGDSGQILWPGGAVTPQGVGVGFPGWRPLVASDYNADGTLKLPALDSLGFARYFAGLIHDPSTVASDAWRYESTVVIHVNPTQTVTVSYPPATAACATQRPTDLTITKTASVTTAAPGSTFTYDLSVTNVNLGNAMPVTITDPIPSNLHVNSITTDGAAFPHWQNCKVTGQDAAGYGGTLTCDLFGNLARTQTAPKITLSVSVDPTTTATSITNTGTVNWTNSDNPSETGSAQSSVTVGIPQPLAVTGGTLLWQMLPFGMLVILAGTGLLLAGRRRKNGVEL